MDRTELLTWLGVIVGIPSLLLFIFGKEWAVGILGVLLVLAFVWFYLRLNQPPFTLEEVVKRVTFRDGTGTDARVSRPQIAVNNHLATEFWVRGLSSDGRIENIRIDGKPPDEVRTEMGKYHICKRFNHPLKPGTKFKLHIEYDLKDSFPGLHFESLLHSADIRAKKVTLEVEFHAERPARSAKLFLRFGGQENELGRPTINGLLLTATIKNPKIGSEYELEWEW